MTKTIQIPFLLTLMFLFTTGPLLAHIHWRAYCECVNKHGNRQGTVEVTCNWHSIKDNNDETARKCNKSYSGCEGDCKVLQKLGVDACSPCGLT